jgi:hypothetical protein
MPGAPRCDLPRRQPLIEPILILAIRLRLFFIFKASITRTKENPRRRLSYAPARVEAKQAESTN